MSGELCVRCGFRKDSFRMRAKVRLIATAARAAIFEILRVAPRRRHLGWRLCGARVRAPPGSAQSVGVVRRVGTAWGVASVARCFLIFFCLFANAFFEFWCRVVALPLCPARRGGCVAVCLGGRCVSCLEAGAAAVAVASAAPREVLAGLVPSRSVVALRCDRVDA